MSSDRQPDRSASDSGVTFRAILIGILLCALLNFLAIRSYVMANRYTGFADHFNTVGVIFLLFWFTLFALGVGRIIGPRGWLRPGELVTIYVMLMVSTAIPTMGLGGYLFPLTAGVRYFASVENQWAERIIPHLPVWVSPTSKPVIRFLFEGLPKDASIPWDAWWTPLMIWGVFALAFFLVSVSIMSLVRRQWVEHEKLVYPLTYVPMELVKSLDVGQRGGFFRNRLMWLGFALSCFLIVYNFSQSFYPRLAFLPPIPTGTVIPLPRGNVAFLITFDTLVIGLTYLVNLDVIFSVCFFHWVSQIELAIMNVIGLTASGPPEPHAAGASGILSSQQVGALLFIAVASLWAARKNLFRNKSTAKDRSTREMTNELLSTRAAYGCLIAGSVVMVSFLIATGLSPLMALVLFGMAIMLMYGVSRILAQTGIGRLRAPCATPSILVGLLGTHPFGRAGLAALGLGFVWAGDIQLFLMGTTSHGMKVASDRRTSGPRLFGAMLIALIFSIAVMFWSYLYLGYRHRLLNGFGWYFVNSPSYHWQWIADCIHNPRGPDPGHIIFLIIGAVAAGLMHFAHINIIGWPLHPVGLAISLTNTVAIDWFSMALAGLVKAIVMRYGGLGVYRKSVPLFLGLVLGSCVGTGLTAMAVALER